MNVNAMKKLFHIIRMLMVGKMKVVARFLHSDLTYIAIQEKGYLSWIYNLDNAERIEIIEGLSFRQKVFLTEVAQNGKTFVEAAKITGYSR